MRGTLPLPLSSAEREPLFWAWAQQHKVSGRPLSASSLTVYLAMWGKFCRHLERVGVTLAQANKEEGHAFLAGIPPAQQERYRSLIYKVYTFCRAAGIQEGPPPVMDKPLRTIRPEPCRLSAGQRDALIAHMQSSTELRDAGLTALLLGTGIRLDEALALPKPRGPQSILVPSMRGRPARTITVDEDCVAALDRWLACFTDPLFPSSRGGSISTTTAWRATSKFLEGAGLRHHGPESLRTTWIARKIVEGWADDRVLDAAGLKNLDALQIYRRLSKKNRSEERPANPAV